MKNIVKLPQLLILFFLLGAVSFSQPDAPVNLSASQANWGKFVFVKLAWQGNSSGFTYHEFYNIYRKNGSISDSGKFRKIFHHVPFESWKDKFVHRGQTYSYYVTALNRQGQSKASDTLEVTVDSNITKAVVNGTVKDEKTGAAVIPARVMFMPVFGWGKVNVKTDSAGNYSARLFPGLYIMYTIAPGYFPQYYDNVSNVFHAKKIEIKSGDSLNISVNLVPRIIPKIFMLSGSVKNAAGNSLKAWITVYNLNANSRSHRYIHTGTDSAGNYSVRVREGDTVVVFARALNFIPEFYNGKRTFLDADRIAINQDVKNINFILEPKPVYKNGITGIIQNNDSAGVESIVLAIRKDNLLDRHRRYSTITDSLGNYAFANMIPGKYILMALPQDDYLPTYFKYDGSTTLKCKDADSVVVDSSGLISGINFTIQSIEDSGAATVSGYVKDNTGNPVTGAMVYATDENQSVYSYGITDRYGVYSITGLVPGRYIISADKADYTSDEINNISLDYVSDYSSAASFTINPESVTSANQDINTVSNYRLEQNYPNPFNPTTTISYQIPTAGHVVLKVFNVLGKEVATLIDQNKPAGNYQITFDASKLSSGVYFYQITAGNFTATRKLLLLK